jgi:GT2 family glycosyltransferase
MDAEQTPVRWVILTMGDRPEAVAAAIASIVATDLKISVVSNGAGQLPRVEQAGVEVVELAENLGVPGGRDRGVAATTEDIIGFLDDDAVAPVGVTDRIRQEFEGDSQLGAVSLRLVDENGDTSRRHVPRPGGSDPNVSGEVALFLGGACAIRRKAYDEVGGYFTELFYGHEELELSWRLVDRGWKIKYLADVEVFHPKTEVERHADGWELTGRNRVWIARRTLPWPVAIVHVIAWLVLGAVRAPAGESRRRYVRGWRSGWSAPIDRSPIRWRTVWRLTRIGRPPLV